MSTTDVVMALSLPGDTTPVVTKLYQQEYVHWSQFESEDKQIDALEKQMTEMAIVQRFVHCNTSWVTESFTINSPSMRKILSEVLENYQDLDLECENWTFRSPYIPLVHRWQRLQDFRKTTSDPVLLKAAQELIDFLIPIAGPSVDALEQTRLTGKVAFDHLWQIFPPGELVMTKMYGHDTVCRVIKHYKVDSYSAYWVIEMEYVDWNGDRCGYQTMKTKIPQYNGYRWARSLSTWPISFDSDPATIKTKMIARGRMFEELRTYHFMQYEGRKIVMRGDKTAEPVSGRVVVDTFAYYTSSKEVKPDLRPLNLEKEKDNEGDALKSKGGDEDEDGPDDESRDDYSTISDELKLTVQRTEAAAERKEDLTPLTDEQCLLATPWVYGFDLKSKEWGLFLVEEMKDIVWNDDAFANLVLPGDEKELAWSFIENKNFASAGFDDFVTDKGRGIIILMFGPPGVGKTYTAEAVAEKGRVPLYSMSAGALGTRPHEVEEALDRALELCRLWNAMLLLDEADVFLSARKEDTLARNELVSIFLTKLEYYQGILFLTTNRAASLDHAFQSRVDLFLPYSDLTTAARRQVWQNFVMRAGGEGRFEVHDKDYDRLSELKLNGREIKNLIKSARLLSMKSGQRVTVDRLAQLAEKRLQALEMLNIGT
ncbi:p-loop containing nucleoside triphosphate hydrolase [Trichoderma arundinaceum]|uniref:p-loop containing nucleoside triphosphate hydrolase n=1 Tax=Trichoderma arundinaceum TaxID=490622 RepID=A0A395NQY6_TRIAR|nr:p-loop containing nucleoside triphosphate hydrolase [Trichoderma arundinaceum]